MNDASGASGLNARAKRALGLIGLALLVMAGSAGVYLWRSAAHPYDGPPPPVTSRPVLVTMTASSEKAAWLVVHDSGGPESVVFHTGDAGATWRRQVSINGPGSIRFSDTRRGVLLSWPVGRQAEAGQPQVFRTSDAGDTWQPVTMPQLDHGFSGVPFFLDPDHAWVLASRPAAPGSGQAQELTLWRTQDGGRRWEALVRIDASRPLGHGLSGADQLGAVSFRDPQTGWIVGRGAAANTVVYVTHDGGHEWSAVQLPGAGPGPGPGPGPGDWQYLGDPAVSAGGRGMMPVFDRDANRILMLRTEDGGDTWPGLEPAPASGPLKVAMVDGSVGWLSDGTGAWVTADSGHSWIRGEALPAGHSLGGLAPVSASVAWAQGLAFEPRSAPTPWALFLTTDAGKHWTRVPVPSLR
jgi:photosystem II stability/assembly factor-like uncharacterized protein